MALEIFLLQDHIKDFVYKAVNGIAGMKNRRKDHVQKFRSFTPGKTDLYFKPRNCRRKPCYQKRPKRAVPDLIIDHQESNANSIKQQTPSQQKHS